MKYQVSVRREFLIRLLSAGFFAMAPVIPVRSANAMSRLPDELPSGKSIFELKGKVLVNGQPADINTQISPNDVIETGPRSHIIFIFNKDAFILRDKSRLRLESDGDGVLIESLRLLTGKLLSVMASRDRKRKLRFFSSTATIGIRGTGIYIESEDNRSYICTCYGEAQLTANADSAATEEITTEHHDAPRFIYSKGATENLITKAPVFNHTDAELQLIEALVGREVPFNPSDYSYDGY
jgi:hypothetical protein